MSASLLKIPGMTSFIVNEVLSNELSKTALSLLRQIIFSRLNSKDGICLALDRPLGCKHHKPNLIRPAVLRQFYGQTLPCGKRFCYGSGTGSLTVGTHPDHLVTRNMTPEMTKLANHIALNIKKFTGKTFELNHCTILFYYHKYNKSPNNLLGYHTDNVYSANGKFLKSKNSQAEDTPTCVLTIGHSRELVVQKQKHKYYKETKRRRWKESMTKNITMRHNSLFILQSSDEKPFEANKKKFRWRHGVPGYKGKNDLSIALVFRSVTNTTDTANTMSSLDIMTKQIITATTLKKVHKSHKRLGLLFSQMATEYEF